MFRDIFVFLDRVVQERKWTEVAHDSLAKLASGPLWSTVVHGLSTLDGSRKKTAGMGGKSSSETCIHIFEICETFFAVKSYFIQFWQKFAATCLHRVSTDPGCPTSKTAVDFRTTCVFLIRIRQRNFIIGILHFKRTNQRDYDYCRCECVRLAVANDSLRWS